MVAALQQLQTEVASCWRDHGGEMDGVVFNAPDRASADASRQSGEATLQSILTEIGTQIVNANYRAAVCDQYTRSVNQYWASSDPAKTFPEPPAWWAKAGY